MLIPFISLVLVLVGCLLVPRCWTRLAWRALQIRLVVSYLALTVLALWIPMTHDIKEKGTDEETLRVG